MTRQTANPTPKAGRNLPVAIGVGVGLFVPLTAGLIWAPWFFTLLIAVGLGLAAVEVHRALLLKGMRSEVVPIVIGTVVSVLGGYIAGTSTCTSPPSASPPSASPRPCSPR